MSRLRIFPETGGALMRELHDHEAIAAELGAMGVRFERWRTRDDIVAGDAPEKILQAYREDIERLQREKGYRAVDVVSMGADHPDKAQLRQKFLSEHTHGEDEVRFFVAGQGLFTLHIADKIYEVLCERGDLIGVPDNTRHWFDMGPNPSFVAIRLFTNPEGWVARFTESGLAEKFPRLEN